MGFPLAKDRKPATASQQETAEAIDRASQVRAVIALMEQGNSENSACATVGINRGTFRSAALKCKVADDYARACEAIAEHQVDAMESAIADMRNGLIDASMARVEIDTRKWIASKVLSKRYGDKLELDHSGGVEVDITKTLTELGGLLDTAIASLGK